VLLEFAMRKYAVRFGLPMLAAVVLGVGVIGYRAGPPSDVANQLSDAVDAFEERRWQRPPLGGEVESDGNAYRAIRRAIRQTALDVDGKPFGGDGAVTDDLRRGELSESSVQMLELESVQRRIRALEDAGARSWSWAGDELAQYARPESEAGTRDVGVPADVKETLRNARILAADALRRGGGACLVQLAQMARFLQDVTAGAPTLAAATRSAGLGNLRYAVATCASRSTLTELDRARRMFEALLEHPAPMGASLRAQVLVAGLTMQSSVDAARWVPTSPEHVTLLYAAPTIWSAYGDALRAMKPLGDVKPTAYPESRKHVEMFADELGSSSESLVSTFVMTNVLTKDQVSQNMLRASLGVLAHYQRIAAGDLSPEPPEVLNSTSLRGAVSGEPMAWRLTGDGRAEICFEADAADGEPTCWELPPWRGDLPMRK
jgi:hypothetical protein